jgi:hypothetical protein
MDAWWAGYSGWSGADEKLIEEMVARLTQQDACPSNRREAG